MTDQHRATPEQWATIERRGAGDYATSSCLLELRARIKALEAFDHHPLLAAVRAQSKTVAHLGSRVEALETHVAAIEPLTARVQAAAGSILYLGAEMAKLGHRVDALEATQHAHIEAKAAEAGARCAVEQMRSRPGSWHPLKVETTYAEARDHARRMVRNISIAPETVEGSFEMGGRSYRYTEAMAAEDDELLAGVDPAANARKLTLVERVADGIANTGWDTDDYNCEARAAIREVAAAALRMHPDPNLTWERVALWFEQEANR